MCENARCFAPGCSNRSGKVPVKRLSFHRLPYRKELAKKVKLNQPPRNARLIMAKHLRMFTFVTKLQMQTAGCEDKKEE